MDHRPDCHACHVPMDSAAVFAGAVRCTDCQRQLDTAEALAALLAQPSVVVEPEPVAACSACGGDGWVEYGPALLAPSYTGPCRVCGGDGYVPVPVEQQDDTDHELDLIDHQVGAA